MQISVSVILGEGEKFNQAPEKVAETILATVGGDPKKDLCSVYVQQQPVTVMVGTPPPPPPDEGPPPEEG